MTVTWWDSEEEARAVLDAVDAADPDVGAGVVALGLHGLGAAALRRAAPALALDPGSVVAALDEVDLGPVSQAWRRVGGEDDDVALMKSDADVGAFRTISMLRQMGVAPEQAVERAASLYGLPPKSAVSVVAKFQAETGPAADAAALGEVMHYAAGLGSDLVAKAYERRGYHGDDPDERDEGGRFAPKGAPPPPQRTQQRSQAAAPATQAQPPAAKPRVGQLRELKAADRTQRQARRKSREAREARTRTAAAAPAAQTRSTAQIMAERRARKSEEKTQAGSRPRSAPLRRRAAPIKTRKWTKADDDVGQAILAEPLWAPMPGGAPPEQTVAFPRVALYAFVPLSVAQNWDQDLSLHAMGHAAMRHGAHTLTPGQVYTEHQAQMEILRFAEAEALDFVQDPNGDEHMVVGGVPFALMTFSGVEIPLGREDDMAPIAHEGTMLTLPALTGRGPREPEDALSVEGIVPGGGYSDDDEDIHQVQVFGASNLMAVNAGQTEDPAKVGAFGKRMGVIKAYETRGYHGDDPDERDRGGRFAPKGAPRPAQRSRQQAPPAVAPKEKPRLRVGEVAALPQADRAARAARRKRRESRQARQVATQQAAQTQARPASSAELMARRRERRSAERGQVRGQARGPALRRASFPTRPPGTPRPPGDAPLDVMLDLDRIGAVAALITASKDPGAHAVMQTLNTLVDTGKVGMEKVGNGWVARNVGQLRSVINPSLEMAFGDTPLNAEPRGSTAALRQEITRENWRSSGDDPLAAVVDAFDVATSGLDTMQERIVQDSVEGFRLDRTGTVVSSSVMYSPAAAVAAVVDTMGRTLDLPVTFRPGRVYESDAEGLSDSAIKYQPGMDWELYDAVSGELVVDIGSARQPAWILIERVSDAAQGEVVGTLLDGSGLQAFRDDAATLYLRTGAHMGQVADLLGVGRSDARFPATLPVNIAVLDHEAGYAT